MNSKIRLALAIYQWMHDNNDYSQLEHQKNVFHLTEIEIKDTPEEFQKFLKDYDLIAPSLVKYGITGPLEDFQYNFIRLMKYINFTTDALTILSCSDYEMPYKLPDMEYDDYEEFETDLALVRDNIFYEQAFVYLVSLLEYYVFSIIKWIYKQEETDELSATVSFSDLKSNMDNLYELLLNQRFTYTDWKFKKSELRKNKISWNSLPHSDKITEAIARRNLIVHNQSIINKEYHFYNPNNGKVGSKLTTDKKYYTDIQLSIEQLVHKLDKKVKEKYPIPNQKNTQPT